MSRRPRTRTGRPASAVSRQLPRASEGRADVEGARRLLIAHVEGRPVGHLIDPWRAAELIEGLAVLVGTLAGRLGAGPDRPGEFRRLLEDIDGASRLIDVFAPEDRPPT